MDRASLRELRRQPGYLRFLGAAGLARVADEMFSVGMVLFVLQRTGSATLAGAVVAALTLPSLVTAPLLGAWMDLRGKRRALMTADQIIATTVLVTLIFVTGHVPVPVLLFVVLLAGITWPLSFGGFTSLIPAIVPEELLIAANAIEASTLNVALIVGPALAGAISALWSPATSLAVEAVLTAAAGVLILGLRALDQAPTRRAESLGQVVRDGLRYLVDVPALRGATVAGSIGLVGIGFLTVAFPFFCTEQLGVGANHAGYLWAAFAFGSTAGALALVRLQRRWPSERIVVAALAMFGVLMLFVPLAGSLPAALVLVAVAGIADGPGLAATFAVRQQTVPRDLQGQVFTTAAGLKVGSFALGSGLAGPIVSGLGARPALLISACVQLLAAGAGLAAMRGRVRARGAARSAGRPSGASPAPADPQGSGSRRTPERAAPGQEGGRRA